MFNRLFPFGINFIALWEQNTGLITAGIRIIGRACAEPLKL